MGLVEDPRGLGLGLAANPLGLGLGLGEDRVAAAVGLAGDRRVLGLALGAEPGGDLPALAADQLEDGRADLQRMIEPAQAEVDDVDSQLRPRRGGDRAERLLAQLVEGPFRRIGRSPARPGRGGRWRR